MSSLPTDKDPVANERMRRRNKRNVALFFFLLVFVALVYAITIVKIRLSGSP
jgi:hypothetical protein